MPLLIIIFLPLFSFFSQCQAFVTSMSRGVYQPNQTIIFDERTFKNPRLLYALCDPENKCRLEHDREPFERPTDTCQVNLQTDNPINKIRVVPFGKDKAILISIENTEEGQASFSLTGVRFSDCSTQEVRSSFDYDKNLDFIFQPILVSYEDFYDVIFVNSNLCGNKYCKLTIDPGTNEIQRSIAWIPVDRDLFIADVLPLGSTDNGLLTVQFSGEISIVKDGDRKVLQQSQTKMNSSSTTLSYSTSNNWIGICELISSILNCSQFNYSGVRKFESTFPIDPTSIQRTTYNLPEGGMLILLVNNSTDIRSVLKLDAHGIQAGKLDLRIRCNNALVPAAQFFEKDNKYCVSLACFDSDSRFKSRLKVAARCFSLSDIKAAWS